MELAELLTNLKDLLAKSRKVTYHTGTDPAIVAIYCDFTSTDPKELVPYVEALRKVSYHNGVDTALLACYAHYKTNHDSEYRAY